LRELKADWLYCRFPESYRCGVNHAPLPTWVVGLLLAPAVAYAAYRARSLSASGAVAAAIIGAAAMAAGWSWGALLIAYFVSSSLLSRWRQSEKDARTAGRVDKGGPRDATQVLANGGVFAAAALAFRFTADPTWPIVAAGALAASAADTWSTEIGILSPRPPRTILGWKPVAPGTSGGVTAQGLAAAAAGAGFVTIATAALRWSPAAVVAAFSGGVFGALFDSVLGATLQSRRWCAACGVSTEQRVHRCGAGTTHAGGIALLDNDGVNAVATFTGGFFGAMVAALAS
jgi:uncharacterized protein (TIGR00297 family)